MNNKTIICGDCHFSVGDSTFLQYQMKFFYDQVIPYMLTNKINTIIFEGDINDSRRHWSIPVENAVHKLFKTLNDHGFKIHIIVGNHDCFNRNSNDENSLKQLTLYPNVNLYYSEITEIKIGKRNFLMVPWQHTLSEYIEFVTTHDLEHIDVVIAHFDIINARMSQSQLSNVGFDKKYVIRWPRVFSGHYHSRSIEVIDDKHLIYTGTPFMISRSCKLDEKGFCVLNLDDLSYEFIENTVSIKFVDINYPDEFSEVDIKNNIIDLHFESEVEIEKIEDYKDKMRKFKPINIVPRITSKIKDTNGKMDLKFTSMKSLFNEYIKTVNIEESLKNPVNEKLDELFELHYKES